MEARWLLPSSSSSMWVAGSVLHAVVLSPYPTKGFCPQQGQRWGPAIQMAWPGSEVVPRGGCPSLRAWRRKLGFAASEGEDMEVF